MELISGAQNVSYNYGNVPADKRNALSTLTIADVKGNLLFVHLAISYLISECSSSLQESISD